MDASSIPWGGEKLPIAKLKASQSRSRHANRYSGEELTGDITASRYALLLFRVKTWVAHGILFDIIRATWLPTLLALAFNVALYVVINVEPKDPDVNNFLQNELFSDNVLSFIGTIVSFLVVFQTDAQQSTNKELCLYHCEAVANAQAIALLVATLRRPEVTNMYKLKRGDSNDICKMTTVTIGVSRLFHDKLTTKFVDPWPGKGKYAYGKIEVCELALLLASVGFDLKWSNRDGGRRYDSRRLPLYASPELAARFDRHYRKPRPAMSALEVILLLVGEELLTIEGLSSDLQLYLVRLIQRILHLRQLVHALSLYQPAAAIGGIFWMVFMVFYVFSCVRDMFNTGWTAILVNLIYVVGFVGAWEVARAYSNPYNVGEGRTGQLSYVALESALGETSIYALFNAPPELSAESREAARPVSPKRRVQAAADLQRSSAFQQTRAS